MILDLTEREAEVVKEWYGHTGWEFMGLNEGESFCEALKRNKRWLEAHTSTSLRIGDDIENEDES